MRLVLDMDAVHDLFLLFNTCQYHSLCVILGCMYGNYQPSKPPGISLAFSVLE